MRVAVVVLVAACGRLAFDPLAGDSGPRDAPCTPGAFGAPVRLTGPINSPSDDWNPTPARGGLDLFMHSYRPGGQAAAPWEARRASTSDPFDTPVLIGELDTTMAEAEPSPTEDALTIVFARVTSGTFDLLEAHRSALDQPFATPVPLSIDTAMAEEGPWLSADGLRLVFAAGYGATGGLDLYETTRPSLASPFAAPRELAELDSPEDEPSASLSPDGLEIFFNSARPGGPGRNDIYTSRRPALDQPFAPPTLLPQLSSVGDDVSPRMSSDDTTLYLNYNTLTSGGSNADIWVSTRPCN